MKASFVGFGEIEIDGQSYDFDVIIDEGKICKRKKKRSKPYRDQFGHTPLSVDEKIPWGGESLIVGTGAYGQLPIMDEFFEEAEERGIEIISVPTEEACKIISEKKDKKIRAILHVTCWRVRSYSRPDPNSSLMPAFNLRS